MRRTDPSFERFRRVAALWNWLPAFRAVAEVGSIHGAARRLAVSPSALSRTVRLLEDEVGLSLFRREQGRLSLTPAGDVLLVATRDAMRVVDDALSQSADAGAAPSGPFYVGASSRLATLASSGALIDLRATLPGVTFVLRATEQGWAQESLLTGEIDVALLHAPISAPGLTSAPVGFVRSAVVCAPTDPLASAPSASLEDLAGRAFAAPEGASATFADDGWPLDLPRRVELYSDFVAVVVEGCVRGGLLGVLPRSVAERSGLVAVPIDVVPPRQVYAVHRTSHRGEAVHDILGPLLDALRARLA